MRRALTRLHSLCNGRHVSRSTGVARVVAIFVTVSAISVGPVAVVAARRVALLWLRTRPIGLVLADDTPIASSTACCSVYASANDQNDLPDESGASGTRASFVSSNAVGESNRTIATCWHACIPGATPIVLHARTVLATRSRSSPSQRPGRQEMQFRTRRCASDQRTSKSTESSVRRFQKDRALVPMIEQTLTCRFATSASTTRFSCSRSRRQAHCAVH